MAVRDTAVTVGGDGQEIALLRLRDLSVEVETLPLEDVLFPQFLSGPMDARQRLEFLRFHMERHIAQIDSVRRHVGFPL